MTLHFNVSSFSESACLIRSYNVDTDIAVVEEFFKKLTARDDIAIVLINQTV